MNCSLAHLPHPSLDLERLEHQSAKYENDLKEQKYSEVSKQFPGRQLQRRRLVAVKNFQRYQGANHSNS